MKGKVKVLSAGLIIGAISIALVALGNPKNMGFCIACFIRDTAGAVGMHRAEIVQYARPEIIGLVLGALICAILFREFSPRGGSSPMTRFVLGFFVMIGALVFLGCPLRMMLRLAGGDWNAIVGLLGFIMGIGVGVFFLKKGYSLKRTYSLPALEGAWLPIVQAALLVILLAFPAILLFSEKGPGSMRAPVWAALLGGLLVGALAQRTRLCTVGGIRDVLLFRDWTLLAGFIGIIAAALIGNLALGFFKAGFAGQPVAHADGLWNFMGMLLTGFGSVLLGGCPLRQLILAGEGNSDGAVTVAGLFVGAAFAHNLKLASAAHTVTDGVLSGGPTAGGKIAVIVGLVVVATVACMNTYTAKKAAVAQTVG